MELSVLAPAVSRAFEALSDAQKAKYLALEASDRERYEREGAARNAAAAAAQAAARDSHAATDASGPRSSRAAAAPAKAVRKVTHHVQVQLVTVCCCFLACRPGAQCWSGC
jgi:hypothetical protein